MAEEEERIRIKTYPCDICGRNFNQDSLAKHRNICKKTSNKARKVFDSGRQRATGSDVLYAKTKETMKIVTEGKPVDSPPKTLWREKHNEFIKSVRQARLISEAEAKGGPVPKFEHSAVPSDYVNCQYCGRNFNKSAAQRHIPFCENQSKRQKTNMSANQRGGGGMGANMMRANGGAMSGGASRYQQQSGPARKVSAESANTNYSNYSSASSASSRGYGGGAGGSNGQIERRPIKYDAQNYYDNQSSPDQGAYSAKNKQLLAQKNAQRTQGNEMLRTGRNYSNNELNNMAKNRSGNSLNSRDASLNRRPVGSEPQQQQQPNGMRNAQSYKSSASAGGSSPSKYCHECGTEFPVAWAKFCSHCGFTRI